MRQRTILLMVIMAVVLEATEAPGCTCPAPLPAPKVALKRAGAVFIGTVTEIKPSPLRRYLLDVCVEIDRVWKGAVNPTMIVNTPNNEGGCGYTFNKGKSYLIYAGYAELPEGLQLGTSLCSRTRPLEKAAEDLAELGPGKAVAALGEEPEPLLEPVAHWAFEEGRGSKVYDWAGKNDGTVHGAKWTTGKVGGALRFDGIDDYVSILDARDPRAYTLTAWVHPKSGSAQGIIVRTSTRGPTREWSHQLLLSSSGKFVHYLYCADGTPLAVTSESPIVVDTWYHVTAVAENNGNMRLYVNGEEQGTAQRIGWLWKGGDRWYIGSNASGLGYFNGVIDEVAIYNRALSAEEIRQLYKYGSPDQVKQSPRKPAEPSAWLVTLTPLGVMFEFRPLAGSSGWVDMELYEHGGEMLAEFSCPHAGEPIQIWLAEPVDEKDPAKYYLRYRIRITVAPLPKWRVIGVSRMPRTTGTTSGGDSGQPQQKPPEPKSVSTSEESPIAGLLPHGEVKDGLAAFLLCHRPRFKVGQPIPLSYGIINVGSRLEWETNLQKAEKNAKLKTRVWWLRTNPELQYNYSWFEVTGPGGKNVPYHGSTGTLRNLTAAVVDKFSVVLYHRQFVGSHYPDLRGPLASDPKHLRHYFDLSKPGTFKVRWGYSPWWKVGPWTGTLMSNEVQFDIVK